jgi:hypothetical protein
MNKRSVKARAVKERAGSRVRKAAVSRRVSGKPEQKNGVSIAAIAVSLPTTTPSQVAVRPPLLRAHRFRVGQTVLYTSSPISRPGASGTYKVVKLLPSDGDDYQYRIKNPGEAFERVAKESQLELDH